MAVLKETDFGVKNLRLIFKLSNGHLIAELFSLEPLMEQLTCLTMWGTFYSQLRYSASEVLKAEMSLLLLLNGMIATSKDFPMKILMKMPLNYALLTNVAEFNS